MRPFPIGFLLFASLLSAKVIPPPENSVPETIQEYTSSARKAESKHQHVNAFRLYCAALALAPQNTSLQNKVIRTSARAQKALKASRDRKIEILVQDSHRRLALTSAQQSDLRRRLEEGRKMVGAGHPWGASVIFRQVQEENPGFPGTQREINRILRYFSRQLKKDRFPSRQHKEATQALYSYFSRDWRATLDTLPHFDLNDSRFADLLPARLEEFRVAAQKQVDRLNREQKKETLWAQVEKAQKSGRFEEAQNALKILLQDNPGDGEARSRLSLISNMLTGVYQTEEDRKKLERIPEWLTQGSLLSVKGQHTDALMMFQKVLDLDPNNTEARDQIIEVQQMLKNDGYTIDAPVIYDNAEKAYRDGLRFYGFEEYQKAQDAFEQALKIKPKHREAKEALTRLNEGRYAP